MKKFLNKKVFFWDFDGVLMDSMPIRNKGFELVLQEFPKDQVELLMAFHLKNGGLSRYVKFRHFFEEIRKQAISEEEVKLWAQKFSGVMRKELIAPELLIQDSLQYIKKHHEQATMHIVSGSDQEELRFLCEQLHIAHYFKSIHGSPTPKKELVKNLISNHNYKVSDCVLIGDSLNDYEAAVENEIDFSGYNNPALKKLRTDYIQTFL